MKKFLLLPVAFTMALNVSNAQTPVQQPATGPTAISLSTVNVAYKQDFPKVTGVAPDTEGLKSGGTGANANHTNLPLGWAFSENTNSATDNNNADGIYVSSSGGGTTASARGVFSFGTDNNDVDRALGAITGGGDIYVHNIKIGAKFTNNTGETLTSLLIEYIGEQWRRFITVSAGSTAAAANPENFPKSKLSFSYRIADGTLNDGIWTAVTALDFESPIINVNGSLNGNGAANRTKKTFTITGLNIPNGATFWIRWEKDAAVDGVINNDALAVDDFSIIPNPSTQPVELTYFNYQKTGSAIKLNWQTSSEKNNDYFELLRSADGINFQSLTKVQGNGSTAVTNNYSHTDFNPLPGTSYYQLKQVDFNGDVKAYPAIAVTTAQQELDFSVAVSSNGNAALHIYSPVKAAAKLQLTDIYGRKLADKNIALESGYNDVSIKLSGLSTSVYVAVLSADGKVVKKKFLGK